MIDSQELIQACACARLRNAARAMTRAYDDALRPAGLTAAQLATLAAIDVDHSPSIAQLSKRLGLDRTTLSRNLKPLENASWIRLGDEGWRRSKTVHVTAEGRRRLARGAMLWESAQMRFLKRFGKSEWKRLETDLKIVATVF